MAFCINCGQELTEGAKFCANCGKAVNNTTTTQRKTVYDGELHKCPNCGELLNSFVTNCPTCGYELRSVKAKSPVNELAMKIERTSSVDEKIELITNFYVPNTREDIFDFFILAVSNLEDTYYDTDDAWRAKLEQTYHKARISFGNTPEFEYIEKLYNRTRSNVSKRWFSNFVRKNKWACITVLLELIGITFLTICIILLSNGNASGALLGLFAMMFIVSPSMVFLYAEEEKKKSKKKRTPSKAKANVQSAGKDAEEFIHEHYEDVAEQLRELGFKNIVTKAEKKGLLDTEGAVKGISIAGNSEFSDDDEFDVNSKIIIRYYSKNC